jgi:hypothetical protein
LGTAAHIDELFADAFATFVGGPAFACMCAFQRFSPTDNEAVEDTETHPSHMARMHLILGVLRTRSDEIADPEWDHVANVVEQTWVANLEAVGKPTSVPALWEPKLDADILRRFQDQVLALISHARYQSWGNAVALAADLNPAREIAVAGVGPGTSIRDILNAGWVARVWWPDDVAEIRRSVARLLLQAAGPRQ